MPRLILLWYVAVILGFAPVFWIDPPRISRPALQSSLRSGALDVKAVAQQSNPDTGETPGEGCASGFLSVRSAEASDDSDGDGLSDDDEINVYHTNPEKSDTDADGLDDRYEVDHMPCSDPLLSLADMDANGMVDCADFSLFNKAYKGQTPDGDVNCSGMVNSTDFNLFKKAYLAQVLRGDLTQDGVIDLRDLILSLKACAGEATPAVCPEADLTGYGRIGLEEAIHIIQCVSQAR